MSASAKAFFGLFILLAIGALAHDIYVWQNLVDYPFNFAALGWITKNYWPDEHQMVVDTLGAETFNSILTPVLAIPAFFLASGLAAFTFAVDYLNRLVKKLNPGRGKDRDQKIKRYK